VGSAAHAVLVETLEAHPDALAYLLELRGAAPAGALIPTTGTRIKTLTLERRVDRAYLVGSRRAPLGFVLAEVQMDVDADKRFAWPLYVELSRSRYRCEGALVVLTVSEAVRRWIKRTIEPATGTCGTRRHLEPTVLALDGIEPSLLLSAERPYLAVMAVAGYARSAEAERVADAAVDLTLERLPAALASEQLDAILGMVDDALRARLEKRVMEHREYRSELFRGIFKRGEAEGRAEGEAKGMAKGEAKGMAKGMAKGEAKGKAEGKAEGILAVLAARDIPVSDAIRSRILGCTDIETLDAWIRRAAVVSTAAAVVRSTRPQAAAPARPPRRRARQV
jgi:hypothetical protein